MGLLGNYINTVRGIAAYGRNPEYIFNMRMYGIRKSFELIESSCSGVNWGGWSYLCSWLRPNNIAITNTIPDPQSLDNIRWGLEQDNLYERVLSGDAGQFADADIETLNYFWIILGDAMQQYASHVAAQASSLSLGWPGSDNPSARWTDD